jgi:hypothetical protein
MTDPSNSNRRRSPRYIVRHQVEGTSRNSHTGFRGLVHNLSAEGCGLHLDRPLPLDVPLEFRCNINGIALAVRGKAVWARAALGGILHGISLTGYASDQDALFHKVYLNHLAQHSARAPAD